MDWIDWLDGMGWRDLPYLFPDFTKSSGPEYPVALSESIPVESAEGREALRQIQREVGLTVDGRLGPQTWAAIFSPVM